MFKAGIITVSDKGFHGEREDKSGETLKELIPQTGGQVVAYKVIPDDVEMIKETLIWLVDKEKMDLVITTGGTGIGPRDCTPEATKAVIEKEVPGLTEAMRMENLEKTSYTMLSRAVSGVRHQSLIVNLPGSPAAVRECMEVIAQVIPHALEVLKGQGKECGRP